MPPDPARGKLGLHRTNKHRDSSSNQGLIPHLDNNSLLAHEMASTLRTRIPEMPPWNSLRIRRKRRGEQAKHQAGLQGFRDNRIKGTVHHKTLAG
jgi:hypothetical protein